MAGADCSAYLFNPRKRLIRFNEQAAHNPCRRDGSLRHNNPTFWERPCLRTTDDAAPNHSSDEDRYRWLDAKISCAAGSRPTGARIGASRVYRATGSGQGGEIVRLEGDGYWLKFPSVTGAAKSAIAMQETLRLTQTNKGDDRLAMRIVIGLGDIAFQEND